jgi:hypothetical protein
MKKTGLLSLIVVLLLSTGCGFSGPSRKDPFAGIEMNAVPAYPDLSVAMILSENSKNSIEYGRKGGAIAGFDVNQIIEKDIEMYQRNFKSIVKVDTMQQARSLNVDLIAIIDSFGDVGLGIEMDGSVIFLTPDKQELETIKGHSERSFSIGSSPETVVTETAADVRNQIEAGLRSSKKLQEYAKSRAPKPVPSDRPAEPSAVIVAIFDINDASKKLEQDALVQLTNYLGTVLTQSGAFKVIPRDQLRSRLLDEKKGSYKMCYDESCQIELGRAVSAQKSLSTTLIQIGNKCAVTANLFDLKTEMTEKGASVETGCNPEELLDAIKEIARQLAGPSTSPTSKSTDKSNDPEPTKAW